MLHIKKTPVELLDDIYTIAYWMTRSESASRELVSRTYVNVDNTSSETEVLKAFRECYVDSYGTEDTCMEVTEEDELSSRSMIQNLKEKAADIKFSVLLSEVAGLRHRQISEVIGKPVETVRNWLFWGRKLFARDCMLKATA